jgi:hypothetical protein
MSLDFSRCPSAQIHASMLSEWHTSTQEGTPSRTPRSSRDTRYYAEPFEALEWRAQWVERMEV